MSDNNFSRREFKLSTASLQNKNTVYLLILMLVVAGTISYSGMPKELFPEIVLPTVMVKTVYPGNPPTDIENLVTRPLENELKTIDGIKTLKSNSSQDNSDLFIEFNSDILIKDALQDVKDAVDRAKGELPDDLPFDPMVLDIDVSEFPIVNVNLSGNFSKEELKVFAEYFEEQIEGIHEISKVEIKGIEDKQIRLNIDKDKMDAYGISFNTIENAIASENVSISGGDLILGNTQRSVRTTGEFKTLEELENIIISSEKGNIIYMRDILENGKAINGYKDALSLARLDKENVVSLQVIKKSGENLLEASAQIQAVIEHARVTKIIPDDLKITITNDQSDRVMKMIKNLENSIYLGVLFVVFVLFFFLGTRNALLVGMSIPMSMLISFVVLNSMDSTINMMVLFGLILALGMLVDNAIVAVENIFRFMTSGFSAFDSAKYAIGEIAWPIIASTATTLAAFVPLMFWPGMMGKFMQFLPLTLIVVLSSSLFVALVMIPVLTVAFAKTDEKRPEMKKTLIITGVLVLISIISYISGVPILGTLMLFGAIVVFFNYLIFFNISYWFQNSFLVKLENLYNKTLTFALDGHKPTLFLSGTFLLLILTMVFVGIRKPQVSLFPANEPQFIVVKTEVPIGSDITATDSITKLVEKDIDSIIVAEGFKDLTKSVLTTVGKGAVGENESPIGNTPQKAITSINFVDFEFREGKLTSELIKKLSKELVGKYPGVTVSVAKNRMGPPTGKPINIELTGEDFDKLLDLAENVRKEIDKEKIYGIEGLKIDLDLGKPEVLVSINRENSRRFGLSTGLIASTIRTALFGKEITDFKVGEDKYPIQIQLSKKYRNNIDVLMNQIITFRNNQGTLVHIPISAVADFKFTSSYGEIKRIDNKRVITLYSNLIEGANGTVVNKNIGKVLASYPFESGYKYSITGEQKDQEEASNFLKNAMLIAVAAIMIIMVTQFNSIVKPFIILTSVLFSLIGVLGGIATFKMDFIIIMTGIGVISLAGVVVNNAIVLIDYIDYLKKRKKEELGLFEDDDLPYSVIKEIIVEAGKTRLRPVLLTAITTILGLVPMATGMNIDFEGFFSHFNPDIYFGGENADFWGPMAWTVIFGLTFATFLTLVMVPVMYLIANKFKVKTLRKKTDNF